MKPKDVELAKQLESGLKRFAEKIHPLPGIHSTACRYALIEQFIESTHRVKYVSVISQRDICHLRGDPTSDLFDPLKAAILRQRNNQLDEAFWLIFYFVHFGKNARTGWRLARDIYGELGAPKYWDWAAINEDMDGFREWLKTNQRTLKAKGHFGNHRKYSEALTLILPPELVRRLKVMWNGSSRLERTSNLSKQLRGKWGIHHTSCLITFTNP